MNKVDPFNVYKCYLSLKRHFVDNKYDYHKYRGKTRSSIKSFYKRRDRFFFEKMSRQKSDIEIIEFFVSNFVKCSDPQSLWIGEIIHDGESVYTEWKKNIQSLSYRFKSEVENIFTKENFNSLFLIEKNRHPQILKEYLQGNISLETFVILDKILEFKKQFDKKIDDPVWHFVSLRIFKYSSFIDIDVLKYKKILRDVVL